MASTCTLYRVVRKQYSDEDLTAVAGETMLFNYAQTLKGHLHWRSAYAEDKVFDVRFDEIMKDEVALLRRIFSFLDMPFTESSEVGVRRWVALDATRQHQRSTATLDEYGVTPAEIEERLSDYFKRYAKYL